MELVKSRACYYVTPHPHQPSCWWGLRCGDVACSKGVNCLTAAIASVVWF